MSKISRRFLIALPLVMLIPFVFPVVSSTFRYLSVVFSFALFPFQAVIMILAFIGLDNVPLSEDNRKKVRILWGSVFVPLYTLAVVAPIFFVLLQSISDIELNYGGAVVFEIILFVFFALPIVAGLLGKTSFIIARDKTHLGSTQYRSEALGDNQIFTPQGAYNAQQSMRAVHQIPCRMPKIENSSQKQRKKVLILAIVLASAPVVLTLLYALICGVNGWYGAKHVQEQVGLLILCFLLAVASVALSVGLFIHFVMSGRK